MSSLIDSAAGFLFPEVALGVDATQAAADSVSADVSDAVSGAETNLTTTAKSLIGPASYSAGAAAGAEIAKEVKWVALAIFAGAVVIGGVWFFRSRRRSNPSRRRRRRGKR